MLANNRDDLAYYHWVVSNYNFIVKNINGLQFFKQQGTSLIEVLVALALFSTVTVISYNVQDTVRKHKNELKGKFNSISLVNEVYRHLQDEETCRCNFVSDPALTFADNGSGQFVVPITDINFYSSGSCAGASPLITQNGFIPGVPDLKVQNMELIRKKVAGTLLNDVDLLIKFINVNPGKGQIGRFSRRFKVNVNVNEENQITSCFDKNTAIYKTIKMRACPNGVESYDDTKLVSDDSESALKLRYRCKRDHIIKDIPAVVPKVRSCFTQNGRFGFISSVKDSATGLSPDGNGEYELNCVDYRELAADTNCPANQRLIGFDNSGNPECKAIDKSDIVHLFKDFNRGDTPAILTADLQIRNDGGNFQIHTLNEVLSSTTTTTAPTTTSTSTTTTTLPQEYLAVDDDQGTWGAPQSAPVIVDTNDTAQPSCAPISYSTSSLNNVSVTGTGPNYNVTPNPGNWSFTYTATCNGGFSDSAVVSGILTGGGTTTSTTLPSSCTYVGHNNYYGGNGGWSDINFNVASINNKLGCKPPGLPSPEVVIASYNLSGVSTTFPYTAGGGKSFNFALNNCLFGFQLNAKGSPHVQTHPSNGYACEIHTSSHPAGVCGTSNYTSCYTSSVGSTNSIINSYSENGDDIHPALATPLPKDHIIQVRAKMHFLEQTYCGGGCNGCSNPNSQIKVGTTELSVSTDGGSTWFLIALVAPEAMGQQGLWQSISNASLQID